MDMRIFVLGLLFFRSHAGKSSSKDHNPRTHYDFTEFKGVKVAKIVRGDDSSNDEEENSKKYKETSAPARYYPEKLGNNPLPTIMKSTYPPVLFSVSATTSLPPSYYSAPASSTSSSTLERNYESTYFSTIYSSISSNTISSTFEPSSRPKTSGKKTVPKPSQNTLANQTIEIISIPDSAFNKSEVVKVNDLDEIFLDLFFNHSSLDQVKDPDDKRFNQSVVINSTALSTNIPTVISTFFPTHSPTSKCISGTYLAEELGNCRNERTMPGCDNKACESVICGYLNDYYCCETLWDSVCASEAKIYCVLDQLPKSTCYSYNDSTKCDNILCTETVCARDPHCCEKNWDFDCILSAVQTCCIYFFDK